MGLNHRGLHVLVTEKVLDGSSGVAAFQDLRGEGMADSLVGGPLGQPCLSRRAVDRFLDDRLVNVMPSLFAKGVD